MSEEIPRIELSDFTTFRGRAANLYHIRTVDNKLVPFKFTESQEMIDAIIEEEYERNKRERGVEEAKVMKLKCRQIGSTTYDAVKTFDELANVDMCNAITMAHNTDTTELIYDIIKRVYDNCPEYVIITEDGDPLHVDKKGNPIPIKVRPTTKSYSGKRMAFEENDSRSTIQTAGSRDDAIKGVTLNVLSLCLGEKTKVVMWDGSTKFIKDIEIGDEVVAEDGSKTKVTNKWFSGHKDVLKLETYKNNEPIYPTKEHKILTDKGWKRAGELKKGDLIKIPDYSLNNQITTYTYDLTEKDHEIRWTTSNGVRKHTFNLDEDFGYLVGYYLAEGHVKKNKNGRYYRVSFAHHEDENYVDRIIDKFSHLATSVRKNTNLSGKRASTSFNGIFLANVMEDICGRTDDKNIPSWFLNTNENFISGVVSGYLCGDGSKTVNKTEVPLSRKDKAYIRARKIEMIKLLVESGYTKSDIGRVIGDSPVNISSQYNKYKDVDNILELFTPDEYYYSYECSATSICERITRQIRKLSLACNWGVPSTYYYPKRDRYGKRTKPIWIVNFSGELGEKAESLINTINHNVNRRKGAEKSIYKDGSWYVQIKSIEDYKKQDTYDIEVEHESHSFETTCGVVSNSEFANFPDGSATLTSGMPSLAHNGRKYVSIESTANGVSGVGQDFYNLWQKSVKDWEDYRAGRATTFDGFRPIFIPWYTIERYSKPLAGGQLTSIDTVDFGSPEIKKHYLQQEEKWTTEGIYDPLHEEKVVLSKDQINWYRTMMKDIAGYDYRKAQRYYPTTPEDAFVASNHCYFDMTSLQEIKTKYLNDGEPECEVGEVIWNDEGEVEFVNTTTGNLKVWERPDREWENRYIISGDIGRGYEDGDYSVAKVKDILKQKYVARWKGRVDQTQFAEIMNMLGLWYNEGLLVPERNLDTVSEILKPDGLRPYVGEMYYDRTAQTVKWGFWTGNNREKMLEFYKTWLREEGYEVLPDLEEVDQHISFVRVLKKTMVKYEADEGAYDDIILANSILNEAERWWLEEGVEPRKYNPDNFIEVIKRPIKKKIRKYKQSSLGRN